MRQSMEFAGNLPHRGDTRLEMPAWVGRLERTLPWMGRRELRSLPNHHHPDRRAMGPGVAVEMESLAIPLEILSSNLLGDLFGEFFDLFLEVLGSIIELVQPRRAAVGLVDGFQQLIDVASDVFQLFIDLFL